MRRVGCLPLLGLGAGLLVRGTAAARWGFCVMKYIPWVFFLTAIREGSSAFSVSAALRLSRCSGGALKELGGALRGLGGALKGLGGVLRGLGLGGALKGLGGALKGLGLTGGGLASFWRFPVLGMLLALCDVLVFLFFLGLVPVCSPGAWLVF